MTPWAQRSPAAGGIVKGHMVLYTATHLSLACLERLVHVQRGVMPYKMQYASADKPDNLESLDPKREYVGQGLYVTAGIGTQWLVHRKEFAVRVPSVLIPEEDNVLLNPIHPDYEALEWTSFPFEWDSRILELITTAAGVD